jgi:thioredoxin reductase (NADPH)
MAQVPPSPLLSDAQLERLAGLGEERTAAVGDVLFRAGDRDYPFMAIVEGEVAIVDEHGHELLRHQTRGFIGEINLLTGQTAYLGAVVTKPMRYIAVEREALRQLMFDEGPLGELILGAFIARRESLQAMDGVGFEIIGPRSSVPTRRLVDFARRSRLAYTWHDLDDPGAAPLATSGIGAPADRYPLVRLPGGVELSDPSDGELSRALGIGRELAAREEVDIVVIGSGPAGLGTAVYAASEGLTTLVVEGVALGGQAGTSRRIENYLGFPAGISGSELTTRAITQARKFGARTATPYRAVGLSAGSDRHLVTLEGGQVVSARAVVIATGAEYRRLPVEGIEGYEGISVFYAAGPPEARRCAATRVGVVGGGNSAGQAAVWLARGGALVTLLHRRASLRETMSDYLIQELERYGVAVRDGSEIAAVQGDDGELVVVTLRDGTELPLSTLFLFLGASPCTEWLDGAVSRDADGFVLTGAPAGATNPFETSVAGVYAAGDVRSGSIKRCATAVGEGANVVGLIQTRVAPSAVVAEVGSAR